MRYNGREATPLIHSECGHGHIVLGVMSSFYRCEGCSQRVYVELDIRPFLDEGESLEVIANVLHVVSAS